MKTFKSLVLSVLFLTITHFGFAQTAKKETFKVSGECGMCKKKIETAAKAAGATYAEWNVDSKVLTVAYAKSSDRTKVQQGIAAVGYDTQDVKATNEAYDKLHSCCKYERTATDAKGACCTADKCTKEGDCCKGADCCKGSDCCKGGEAACCQPNSAGAACTKENNPAASCCKKA